MFSIDLSFYMFWSNCGNNIPCFTTNIKQGSREGNSVDVIVLSAMVLEYKSDPHS